jgi:hypothetical protein
MEAAEAAVEVEAAVEAVGLTKGFRGKWRLG